MVRESHLILGYDVRLEKQPVVLSQVSTAHSTATALLFPEQGCRLLWQLGSKATPGEIGNSSSRSEELEPVTLLPQKGEVSSSPYLMCRPCTSMGIKAVRAWQLFTFSSFTMSTPLQSPFVCATKSTCLLNSIRTPGHLLKGKSEARYRSFISHLQSHLLAFQAASLPLLFN